MKLVLAADHAGYELKAKLAGFVRSLGHEVDDAGAYELDATDDYPAFVAAAARAVQSGTADRGIVIGASGQGEAMAANRFKGVRCALYYGRAGEQIDATGQRLDMIASSREHNDSNMLSLAGRFLTEADAQDAVKHWLNAPFGAAERHVRRIAQMDSLDSL